MATPPEQLQAKPVLRIKAAETRVFAFLSHKNLVNSLPFDSYSTLVKRVIFSLFSLNNYIGPDLCHTSKNLNSSFTDFDIARGKSAAW